ncbi:MAG TPA: hypothetical protein VHQ00_03175 [Chloroflexota bacterium]|nr:hypothetical protein [Chloroflexota bacterium]
MPRRLLPCALGLYLALLPVLLSVLPPALPAGAQGAPGESPAQPTPAPGATAAPQSSGTRIDRLFFHGDVAAAPGGAPSGAVFALDERGQAIPNLDPRPLQATLDERPVTLTWAPQRPRMAILVGFLLSPSASEPVRRALAQAVKERLAGLDLRSDGDAVAVAGTSNPLPWSQATFTSSADDLALLIDRTLQAPPPEGSASLREVEGGLRAVAGQPGQRIRVLLLVTNQPLGGLTTPAGELEAIRTLAEAQRIQVGVLNLPAAVADGGISQLLVQRTPGGRVAYASGATTPADLSPHIGVLLAPALGVRRFTLPAPEGGPHTLTITVPGGGARATAPFTAPPRAATAAERLLPWLVLGAALAASAAALTLYLRGGARGARGTAQGPMNEFPPFLRAKAVPGVDVRPETISFLPPGKKLRIGYHPPHMDNVVGSPEFSRLPFQDVRGDPEAEKGISRHVACIWRDKETNDCYIQLGWPGPGEPIRPREQTQVLDAYGRPQDATSQPYRLKLNNVVRLSSSVEYVFKQFLLSDKTTEVEKKISAFNDNRQPAA